MVSVAPNWQSHLNGPVHELLEKLGNKMVEESQTICPVLTGRLQDSITHFIEGKGLHAHLWFGATAPYALYVEMGHHLPGGQGWVPAQPFIRPVAFKYATAI